MTKWKWGNFDQRETFVDESYGAEIQAMKMVMMRTCDELMTEGKVDKASNLAKQYFSSFPHFNFPYDESIISFIEVIGSSGDTEEAKKHLAILGEETRQKLVFYESLDDDDVPSFSQEWAYAVRSISGIISTARDLGDETLLQKLATELEPHLENYRSLRN